MQEEGRVEPVHRAQYTFKKGLTKIGSSKDFAKVSEYKIVDTVLREPEAVQKEVASQEKGGKTTASAKDGGSGKKSGFDTEPER